VGFAKAAVGPGPLARWPAAPRAGGEGLRLLYNTRALFWALHARPGRPPGGVCVCERESVREGERVRPRVRERAHERKRGRAPAGARGTREATSHPRDGACWLSSPCALPPPGAAAPNVLGCDRRDTGTHGLHCDGGIRGWYSTALVLRPPPCCARAQGCVACAHTPRFGAGAPARRTRRAVPARDPTAARRALCGLPGQSSAVLPRCWRACAAPPAARPSRISEAWLCPRQLTAVCVLPLRPWPWCFAAEPSPR